MPTVDEFLKQYGSNSGERQPEQQQYQMQMQETPRFEQPERGISVNDFLAEYGTAATQQPTQKLGSPKISGAEAITANVGPIKAFANNMSASANPAPAKASPIGSVSETQAHDPFLPITKIREDLNNAPGGEVRNFTHGLSSTAKYAKAASDEMDRYGVSDKNILNELIWQQRASDYSKDSAAAVEHLGGAEWSDLQGDELHRKNVERQIEEIDREMKRVGPNSPSYAAMKAYKEKLTLVRDVYTDRETFYKSFANENEYEEYRSTQKALDDSWKAAEQNGKSREEWANGLQRDAEDAEAAAERAQWEMDVINKQLEVIEQVRGMAYSDEAMQKMVHEDGTPYTREEVDARYEQLLREKKAYEKTLDDAERARRIANAASSYGHQQRYSDLPERTDWNRRVEAGRGIYGRMVSKIDEERAQRAAETRQGNVEVAGLSDEELAGEDYYTYRTPNPNLWSEDETNTYYYLLSRSQKEAFDYALEINKNYILTNRSAAMGEQQKWAHDNPFWGALAGSTARVATAPLAIWDWLGSGVQYLNTGTVMPRTELSPRDYANAWSGGAAQHMNELGTLPEDWWVIGGKGLGDAYQLGNSVLESLAFGKLGKAIQIAGGPEWLGAVLTNVSFFGSAADEATQEALSRGATAEQAMVIGIWSGAAEALGETVSIEHLINLKDPEAAKTLIWNVLKQSGIEASEEALTTIVNTYGDMLVMGDKSEINTKVEEYMRQGMSRKEAEQRAWREWNEGLLFDALGGALSGGASGAVTQAKGYLSYRSENANKNAARNTPTEVPTYDTNATQGQNQSFTKPEFTSEPQSASQKRVVTLLNNVKSKEQLGETLQKIQDSPALDAALEELTGMDAEAHLAKASQEAVGDVLTPDGTETLETSAEAPTQAPAEFNGGNTVVELSEPEVPSKKPGKNSAHQMAVDAMLSDMAKEQSADKGGIDVDAEDFVDDGSFDAGKAFPRSADEAKADSKEVIGKLRKAIPDLKGMQPVRAITGTEFTKGNVNLVEQVAEFFRTLGNKVTRAGFGDVAIDRRSVKDDIAHGIGRAKAASFIAIPDVITNGKIIDKQTNWKGRGYDSYVIAAPVTYKGKRSHVAAVVLQNKNNRFYLHEIISADGSLIYKANDAPASFKTGITENVGVTGKAGTSNSNVADSESAVKGKEPESSAEYIQQTRLTKQDFERREANREKDDAAYKAEEAKARDDAAKKEVEEKAKSDAEMLADAKKAYGEAIHQKLTEMAKKLKNLVGNSRLESTGVAGYLDSEGNLKGHLNGEVHEAFSYKTGGEEIESFANAFGEFAAGRQTFRQVADAYLGLDSPKNKNTGSYFYDEIFGDQFEALAEAFEDGNYTNKDGTLDEDFARRVEELSKRVTHRFEYMQKMLAFRDHLAQVYEKDGAFKSKAGMLAKALEAANRFQLRPSTAFKMLSGYNKNGGFAWYQLADMSRDATKNFINIFQNAQDYLRDLTASEDWEDFSTGKTTVKNVIPGLKYDGGRISANAAVSFLKMLETNGSYDHIIRNGTVEMARTEKELYSGANNNGFGDVSGYSQTFDPISKKTRALLNDAKSAKEKANAWKRASAELDAIKNALHSEINSVTVAKAAYDASFAPLNFLAKALNKTSRKVWGTNVAVQGKFYWPLEAGGKRLGQELLNDHSFGLDRYRNVQERTGDRGGLMVRPFTDVMQGYIRSASHWAAYQELSDTLHVLSKNFEDTQSITQLLNNNAGKAWSNWLENYEDDLNGKRGKEKGWAGKILGGLRSNLAQGSLLLNGSVALKQAPSMLDFMTVLDADIVAKRFATGVLRSARSFSRNPLVQVMEQYSKMLKNRQAGYNTVEEGEATEIGRKGSVNKLVAKLPGWMTNWITKTDYRTVANGLLACEDQVKRNIKNGVEGYAGIKVGSDEYYQAIADMFENAVMDTQPIYNKEYRAEALRTDNEVLRLLGMFRTQQTQNYNNLVETIGEYKAAKTSGDADAISSARSRMLRTIGGQFAAAVMFAVLDGSAKVLLHKRKQYEDEEGNFSTEKFLQKVGWNSLNSIIGTSWFGSKISPFLVNNASNMLNKATGGKVAKAEIFSGALDGTLGMVDDVANALVSFNEKPNLKNGKALIFTVSSLLGIPTRNAYNMLNTVYMYGVDWGVFGGEKTYNAKNYDDMVNMFQGYYDSSPSTRGKAAMSRAIDLINNGYSDQADKILSTLDPNDSELQKSAKNELKNAFVSGKISDGEYRTILRKYFGASFQEAADLASAGNAQKAFNKAKSNAISKVGEDGYKDFEKSMKSFNSENDPWHVDKMAAIFNLGLSDSDTDIFVQKYLPSGYASDYKALRGIGIKPERANEILQNIDNSGGSGDTSVYSISQSELYDWLLDNPKDKRVVEAIWKSKHYKTGFDEYRESQDKNPVNILASYVGGREKAEKVYKSMDYDGNGSLKQEEFFAYLKSHPEQEDALKVVFAAKWPKSDFEQKRKLYA